MPSEENTEKTTRQIVNELYPLVDDAELRSRVNSTVCDFVTYDATSVSALQHFQPVQENTECIFAKRAVLWGNRDWDTDIGLGTLAVKSALSQQYYAASFQVKVFRLASLLIFESENLDLVML